MPITCAEPRWQTGQTMRCGGRVLVTEWEGRPVYVKVQAYYRPRSGEFLSWNTGGLSEHGYASDRKENPPKPGASCELPYHHILLLKDGEWADFWASDGRAVVFHCNLRFETRETTRPVAFGRHPHAFACGGLGRRVSH